MINNNEDITDKEFEEILLPFHNNLNDYMIKFIIPDTVSFYLANGYFRNCLSNCSLINHINSAIDIFNIQCNINKLIPEIELILRIKYNLLITNNNPLKLSKYM